MEKVVVLVRADDADDQWCERIRGPVADELLDLGVGGLTVNVRDSAVRHSVMTLTTLAPPVAAVISIWTHQSYGRQITAAVDLLARDCHSVAAYLVTESVPMAPPEHLGERCPGLANVALLRRPQHMDHGTWLTRWQTDHTQVAIDTQATFGYTQNVVVRPLTPDAPVVDGIVEELFPDAATTDLHAFFGAVDDADLEDRMTRMVASTSAFGATENIDTVPTSRFLLRSPFSAT
ncbi:hypothetical protein [Aeromicrobium sp.]|uniref:hypothetical protein n=1 Tax=Aeromicrobium sp. TaxID=1871063 RepID=UPI002FC65A72